MRDFLHRRWTRRDIQMVVADQAMRLATHEAELPRPLHHFPHRPLRRPRFTMPRILRLHD